MADLIMTVSVKQSPAMLGLLKWRVTDPPKGAKLCGIAEVTSNSDILWLFIPFFFDNLVCILDPAKPKVTFYCTLAGKGSMYSSFNGNCCHMNAFYEWNLSHQTYRILFIHLFSGLFNLCTLFFHVICIVSPENQTCNVLKTLHG